MIISDKTLKGMIWEGLVTVGGEPVNEKQIQPASVDFRLGNSFTTLVGSPNRVYTIEEKRKHTTTVAEEFVINPGQFVLATTQEYYRLPDNVTAFVEGRSSVGRNGLFIQNAGWVDPGFEGEITLELYNASPNPIQLRCGDRLGQMVFVFMDHNAENPYRGKYQGQRGATASRMFNDYEYKEG